MLGRRDRGASVSVWLLAGVREKKMGARVDDGCEGDIGALSLVRERATSSWCKRCVVNGVPRSLAKASTKERVKKPGAGERLDKVGSGKCAEMICLTPRLLLSGIDSGAEPASRSSRISDWASSNMQRMPSQRSLAASCRELLGGSERDESFEIGRAHV